MGAMVVLSFFVGYYFICLAINIKSAEYEELVANIFY